MSRGLAQRWLVWVGVFLLLPAWDAGVCAQASLLAAEEIRVGGIGYSPVPLQATEVTLVTEEVTVYLAPTYAEVRTALALHNPGGTVTLPVGFPQDQPASSSQSEAAPYEGLRASVDGEPLALSFLPYADVVTAPASQGWQTVVVPFEAGQTRELQASYRVRNSLGAGDVAYFQYILSTGAIWPQPIDALTVTVYLTDTLTWDQFLGVDPGPPGSGPEAPSAGIAPGGYRRIGNQIRWHWYSVEPDRGHNLALAFYRQPVRVPGEAEAVLAPREPKPEPAESSLRGWALPGLILVLLLVLAAVAGRSRRNSWKLRF